MGETLTAIGNFFGTFSLEDWGTVATIASLGFVAHQTRLLRKTYKYTCDWQEKEKAAELAVMYKNEILPSISYISEVLKSTGIMDLLGNIRADNIDSFNQVELHRLAGANIKEKIQEKMADETNIRILWNSRSIYKRICNKQLHSINSSLVSKWYAEQYGKKDESGNAIILSPDEKRHLLNELWFEFHLIISDTLNSLEYFSMNFNSRVADDEIVFQSLHQTYITVVQLLYYYIAEPNIHEKDKYYTNVIKLYKKWMKTDVTNERLMNRALAKAAPFRPVRK